MKNYILSLSVISLFLSACATSDSTPYSQTNSVPEATSQTPDAVSTEPFIGGSVMMEKPTAPVTMTVDEGMTMETSVVSCQDDPNQAKCLQTGGAGGVILRNTTSADDGAVDCVTNPLQAKCTQTGGAGGVILRNATTVEDNDVDCVTNPLQAKCTQTGGAGGVILRNTTSADDDAVDCVTNPLQAKCTQTGGAGGVILRDNE